MQNRRLIQTDVKFQLSVFIFLNRGFPRICLNKVPIVKVDVLTLELKYKPLRNILLIRCKLHAAAVINLQYMTICKML